ncbi:hypothetical protein SDRG_01103 [Saprolegnia diclina VS20]|uniref:Ricin B lectin domain-containing protein n=1 Tax=Saprolegnia diclina (strain VS20) TaxID=1156394 RepID=T0QSJ2_SAPDV|nr:hypothetical protein SDRG_01103 [Saprolegnia diclina VS20]EQC41124.1 hypothetical protein SDRG_01103 [Saprolegnia diclina VS20]|eukprot:XP_008604838.1 hypothetical protein SDRG_01103 [Saprolegnia diclina VS20]
MLRFAAFSAAAVVAADQCCFKDGDVISLRSDTGNYIGRCNNCVAGGAYKDSAFVHVKTPASSPWAQWTVVNTGNGKIALRADSGKYLSRCNNCAPGAAYPDEAFVHVDDWTTAPWAQWTCKEAGDGKVALQADTGKFLARCNNCVAGAYADTAMVHATSIGDGSWVQWTIESDGAFREHRCAAPTRPTSTETPIPISPCTATPSPTPAPTTATPLPTIVPTVVPCTDTPSPATETPAPTTQTPAPTTGTPRPTTDAPIPTTATPVPTPCRLPRRLFRRCPRLRPWSPR